jgi:hypothetical protein
VTEQDIKRGERHKTEKCPIARAARRALHSRHVEAEYDCLVVEKAGTRRRLRIPQQASDFIEDFDASGSGYPFSFEVRAW